MATHLRPSHWASWPDSAACPLTGADVAHNTSSPREPDRHPPSGPRQRIPELPLPLRYTNVSIESFIHPSRRFYSCAFLSDCRISPYHIPAVARRTLAIKDLFTPDKAASTTTGLRPPLFRGIQHHSAWRRRTQATGFSRSAFLNIVPLPLHR